MKVFTYVTRTGALKRINFDRPVKLYNVQVANMIIATVDWPSGDQTDRLTNEMVSRYTPELLKLPQLQAGYRILVDVDRVCNFDAVIVTESGEEYTEKSFAGST